MHRQMLGSKIHRARVTGSEVDYEGSITVDAALLEAAGILQNETVHVWDVTSGARVTTYAIAAPAGSGTVCANGAAAHHITQGDLVIIATFVHLDDAAARSWQPRVVFVDECNHIFERPAEAPGAGSAAECASQVGHKHPFITLAGKIRRWYVARRAADGRATQASP